MKKNLWTLGSIILYNQSPTNLGFEHWLNTAHLAYSRDWKEIKSTGQAVKKQKLNMLILYDSITDHLSPRNSRLKPKGHHLPVVGQSPGAPSVQRGNLQKNK